MWSAEIKELKQLYQTFKGQHPKLDKELDKLIITDDENMALVYARRCLEVMITDLCETELNRPRGTEPLKGIIDKLNKEEKVPHNIVVSMQNLNSLSSFGAHPKDFDPRQVKPVLLDLTIVLEWYLKHLDSKAPDEAKADQPRIERTEPASSKKDSRKSRKSLILISGSIVVCAIIIISLIVFDVIGNSKKTQKESIGSIVVLPFSNFTGIDSLEYFFDGLHSALIGNMGKIGSLHIPGATTSRVYKDSDMSATQIASELKMDAVLELDFICFSKDSVCMQTRLVKTGKNEKQIWVRDFKESKSHILNLYNKMTRQLTDELKIELTDNEVSFLAEDRTVDPEALDAYLKGQFHWERLGEDDIQKAMEYFQFAIEKDPDWAPPYTGMAMVWAVLGGIEKNPLNDASANISKYVNKAILLDPNSADPHYVKAIMAVWDEWDWEKGEKEFLKTLELNPNDALCRIYYAHLLMILRRHEEALYQANLALELDPLRPLVLGLYAAVMNVFDDYQSALIHAEKALSIDPNNHFALSPQADAYYYLGDYDKWFEIWKEELAWWDDETLESIEKAFHEHGHLAAIEETIKVNEEVFNNGGYISFIGQAQRYLRVKKYEQVMDCLEKAYEIHDGLLAYSATNEYSELKDNPRNIELLKKMNLPLPEN